MSQARLPWWAWLVPRRSRIETLRDLRVLRAVWSRALTKVVLILTVLPVVNAFIAPVWVGMFITFLVYGIWRAPCCDPVFGNGRRLHWMRQRFLGGIVVVSSLILLPRLVVRCIELTPP